MKKWQIISEEDVSPSKWFPVYKHVVKLPNGNIVDDYYLSRLGNVAMVLPVLETGNIVFVKQYKHGKGEFVIELPAGLQKDDKSIEQSAIEELEEEVGIKVELSDLIPIGKLAGNPAKTDSIIYGYLVKNTTQNSKQNLDPNEDIEVVSIKPSQALKMIAEGTIWVNDTVAFVLKTLLLYPDLFKDEK